MNNNDRRQIAQETLHILEQGGYHTLSGNWVSLADELQECIRKTQCYSPEQAADRQEQTHALAFGPSRCEVTGETTLQAAARLASAGVFAKIGALNFASARNPGGGFLGGAQAQEESLARSSGLYQSLLTCPAYYEMHRSQSSCLYSDSMIYSPRCPVFRTDEGTLLEQPFFVDFITSPAPNAGVIRRNEPENTDRIGPVLKERSGKALALAAFHGCDAVILGAWGCGVFQNDPAQVAEAFFGHLGPDGAFADRFPLIVFAVLDRSPDQAILTAFTERFGDS